MSYSDDNTPYVIIEEKRIGLGGISFTKSHELMFYDDESREKFR